MSHPAMNLSGGWVLVHPSGVGVISRALAAAEQMQRRDGYSPPLDFALLAEAFATAVREQRPSGGGRSEVPQQRALGASAASAVRMVLANPVTAEQAAELLGCTARNVRDLCGRGVFESAQRDRSGWEIERAEVAERALLTSEATSARQGRRRRAGRWAEADQQAGRGANSRW